jgi:hypothetical protein
MERTGQVFRDSTQQAPINPVPSASMAIPSRVGSARPLINTSRFSGPPSDRPDWRDPAQQWDAKPVTPFTPSTTGFGQTIPINDAIAQNNANMSDNQRRALDFLSLSPSSVGVVRAVRQPEPTGIAGGQTSLGLSQSIDQDVADARFNVIPANQSPIAPMFAGQQPMIDSGPVVMSNTGTQSPEQRGLTPTQTPYGTVYGSQPQTESFGERATAYDSGRTRTPQQQQALLAQMRETGAGIRQNIIEQNIRPSEEATSRAYAFREGMAERRAQEALDPSRNFGEVGEGAKRRGEQYLAQAAEYREIGAGRRRPMSREPLNVGGTQVRRSSMGQYTPIVDPSRIGAFSAPTTPMASAAFGGMGSQIGNTIFDSFDSGDNQFDLLGGSSSYLRRFGMGA